MKRFIMAVIAVLLISGKASALTCPGGSAFELRRPSDNTAVGCIDNGGRLSISSTSINGVPQNWPPVQGPLNTSLQNDGAGNLSWTSVNLTGPVTSVGNATTIVSPLPALSGANLTSLTAANISAGTAGISVTGNAATVTTNANLTGPITSVGNATTIAGPVPPSTVDLSTVTTALALKVDRNAPDQINLSTVTTALAGKQGSFVGITSSCAAGFYLSSGTWANGVTTGGGCVEAGGGSAGAAILIATQTFSGANKFTSSSTIGYPARFSVIGSSADYSAALIGGESVVLHSSATAASIFWAYQFWSSYTTHCDLDWTQTADAGIHLRLDNESGSSYRWEVVRRVSDATQEATASGASDTEIQLTGGFSTDGPNSHHIEFSLVKMMKSAHDSMYLLWDGVGYLSDGSGLGWIGSAQYTIGAGGDGRVSLRIFPTTGTIDAELVCRAVITGIGGR